MVFMNVTIKIEEPVGVSLEGLPECIESIKVVRKEYEDVYLYPQGDDSRIIVSISRDDTCRVLVFDGDDLPRVLPIFPRQGTAIIFRPASKDSLPFQLRVDEYGMWEDTRDYTEADPRSIGEASE